MAFTKTQKRKNRKTNKRNSKSLKGGGALNNNVAAATYDVNVVFFSEDEPADDIKKEILDALLTRFKDVTMNPTSMGDDFVGVTDLPGELLNKYEISYQINDFPKYLRLKTSDYRPNESTMNNLIDAKLTNFETELSELFKNTRVKLIPGVPGIHSASWIPANFAAAGISYIYAVGLILREQA